MLASKDNILPIFFGWFALKSFTESDFAKVIATKPTEFEPPTGRQAKPCVLKLAPELHPKGDEGLLPSEYEKTIRKIKYGVLHKPWATNVPLVDSFFFSESNPRTLVGLRMTTAGAHHTTAGTVGQFTECLAVYFNGWGEFAQGLSWEIICLRHAASTPMNDWQRCDVVNSNNVSNNIKPRDCGVLGGELRGLVGGNRCGTIDPTAVRQDAAVHVANGSNPAGYCVFEVTKSCGAIGGEADVPLDKGKRWMNQVIRSRTDWRERVVF
ncbi:putative retrotransposon hot spot protein (RHS) [Trypanosoma cruzi]|uniref:Putative retrotransposon hot spot protein (RHS) n=1 Tax=Trypanosoma cruzi TaxID=5693 RepID=A0A2V2V1R7_TRYCR|nr:putative retrotransposon hot spot protein (RHS) [Trypanosoma cruzi]